MSKYAIDIENLRKVYKSTSEAPDKEALIGTDLKIRKGSIFGLLGPNGAGKSTMINIVAGLVTKTSGSVKVWGYDLDKDVRDVKLSIGVVPQEINFDPFFTPGRLLDIQAGMYGVPQAERRTKELLELVGLEDKEHAHTRSLSGGMRRRLMVAKAMVHNPPILVLDEPTAGVDIELRQKLWENVQELNRKGTTILLTTHYLEEAEQLCDEIAIINHGDVIVSEKKDKLLERIDQKEITFRLDKPLAKKDLPKSLAGYHARKGGKKSIICRYSPGPAAIKEMVAAIQSEGYNISDISTGRSDLEDVFLQLTAAKAS